MGTCSALSPQHGRARRGGRHAHALGGGVGRGSTPKHQLSQVGNQRRAAHELAPLERSAVWQQCLHRSVAHPNLFVQKEPRMHFAAQYRVYAYVCNFGCNKNIPSCMKATVECNRERNSTNSSASLLALPSMVRGTLSPSASKGVVASSNRAWYSANGPHVVGRQALPLRCARM